MIRSAKDIDIYSLLEIERASFGPDLGWDCDELTNSLNRDRIIVWEAQAAVPWVAGYAAMKIQDGTGTLTSVAVLPSARGHKIGALLVLEAVKRMIENGAECIELECNTDLVLFYSKLSFEVCGFYTTGVREKQKARVCMRIVVP